MTNKREWDSFVRSKERYRVFDYYQKNRIECFNIWLESGKSWDSVALHVEREHAQSTEAKSGWIAIQGKTLKQTHSEEKFRNLVNNRKSSGLWYPSEDFADDDDETSSSTKYVFF